MHRKTYSLLSLSEKSYIETFYWNRSIQKICRKRDTLKYILQFSFLGIYFFLFYLIYNIWIIPIFVMSTFYILFLVLIYLILNLYTLKLWKNKWKELFEIFDEADENISLKGDITILRRKYFLNSFSRLNFIRNNIRINNDIIGSEVSTIDITWGISSNHEYISNYCFLFKIKLKNKIDEKIQIIKVRDSKNKIFIFSLAINSIFAFILFALISYFSVPIIMLLVYVIYRGLLWLSWYSWESSSGNIKFDKKYLLIWKKTGIIKDMKKNGFFNDFSEFIDKKTTYELCIYGNIMYIKLDFLRSSPSRLLFIYNNIFNLRSSKRTLKDFYVDTIRIKHIKKLIDEL